MIILAAALDTVAIRSSIPRAACGRTPNHGLVPDAVAVSGATRGQLA